MAFGQTEFASGLKALGINVSRETLQRLATYAALLEKWQAKINLVGPATLPDLWRRHFLDSAQLLPLLPVASGTLVDLGSGAGFPGLVLAAMTDWRVHLLDSDQRKCAFLRQVAVDCGLVDRVTIHPERIEQVTGIAADVVTARACAPLVELLELAEPFIGEKGTGLFLKGAQAEEELTQAQRRWTMRLDRRESISDPAGVILIVTHLKQKGQ
ncbi:MAG TPA: 16S rRNA (guanine(527)-N(7))-methyltransferase RsmG [Dongiaceae bacterium]|nr:16S rRNA (guanine(527)-N(7))-methyltransferase RsmG [Dongiaceae bacterium]